MISVQLEAKTYYLKCYFPYILVMLKMIYFLVAFQEILNATVKERENFQAIVEAQDNLHLIDLSDWAGLGAVQ